MKVWVTGSSGLIDSEAVDYDDRADHSMNGVDKNIGAKLSGVQGNTLWNFKRLQSNTDQLQHDSIDIRDRLLELFQEHTFDLIVHCAAQPAHDKAYQSLGGNFGVNALGTVNLLAATRQFCPEAVFIPTSTNKVYSDFPSGIPRVELEKRHNDANTEGYYSVTETYCIDAPRIYKQRSRKLLD